MLGKIIGAFVGGRVAEKTSGVGGPTGAALGVLAPAILRRLSIPGMLALAAGGYIAKRIDERKRVPDAAE
ncbi:hypothetical protein GRI58_02490 [Porphyrobacter algicida]|uniref:Uncharacterized protein n=1 Tax=Qipengyuania algicida TaxID=1836209 RepID=A0A845ABS1_9SPHN|nr:hypothetical protein [Qipengyuania algicida]MXP27690.1 hypothetical protein [Qipengyuania algicida]